MTRQIKRIYDGLPEGLKELVVWVADKYRTNPLSLEMGGTEVIVEYQTNQVFGYDKIKHSGVYISAIMNRIYHDRGLSDQDSNFESLLIACKAAIRRVFARKIYSESDYEIVEFQEVWNFRSAEVLPESSLTEFENKEEVRRQAIYKNNLHDVRKTEFYSLLLDEQKRCELAMKEYLIKLANYEEKMLLRKSYRKKDLKYLPNIFAPQLPKPMFKEVKIAGEEVIIVKTWEEGFNESISKKRQSETKLFYDLLFRK